MMDATRIHSFNSFVRMMYAYSTPEIARHDGWLKIGDTRQGVDERIGQQTHTADVLYELQWKDIAMYRDDCTFFRDYQFHDFLTGYKGIERNDHTEWFRIDGQTLRQYFEEFATRDYQPKALHCSYTLRREQEDAVGRTLAYLKRLCDGCTTMPRCAVRFPTIASASCTSSAARCMALRHLASSFSSPRAISSVSTPHCGLNIATSDRWIPPLTPRKGGWKNS